MDEKVRIIIRAVAALENRNMAQVIKLAIWEYCQKHTYTAIWDKAMGQKEVDHAQER